MLSCCGRRGVNRLVRPRMGRGCAAVEGEEATALHGGRRTMRVSRCTVKGRQRGVVRGRAVTDRALDDTLSGVSLECLV